jgi:hypothetical protein
MLAFIHIEKCAGTTLIHMLRRNFMHKHIDVIPRDKQSMLFTKDDMLRLIGLTRNIRSIAGHSVRLASELDSVVKDIQYCTILRDPVKRYISDFKYCWALGIHSGSFEDWLQIEDRKNFQTKAISGDEDVDRAKRMLTEKIAIVGIAEEFDTFLQELQVFLWPERFPIHYQMQNVTADRFKKHLYSDDISRYNDRIRKNNLLDIELYRHAREVILPSQHKRIADLRKNTQNLEKVKPYSPSAEKIRIIINRLYRNAIYKPYSGHKPFAVHTLIRYKKDRKGS